jgi:hypothetical protein
MPLATSKCFKKPAKMYLMPFAVMQSLVCFVAPLAQVVLCSLFGRLVVGTEHHERNNLAFPGSNLLMGSSLESFA